MSYVLFLICIFSELMTGSRDLGQQSKMERKRKERGMRRCCKETRMVENVVMQEKGGKPNREKKKRERGDVKNGTAKVKWKDATDKDNKRETDGRK